MRRASTPLRYLVIGLPRPAARPPASLDPPPTRLPRPTVVRLLIRPAAERASRSAAVALSFPPLRPTSFLCSKLDFIRVASAMKLQLKPATTTPAPGSSTREESTSTGPITAAPALEASAPEGSTPVEPAPKTPPEEAAGTSKGPGEILKAGPGYKNVINTDLVDDPMLTANNIRTFKKAYKELYDFAIDVITHSQKKSEKLKTVVSGHQELAALDKRISEELMKNGLLERKLQMLEHEKTRETWLLKNDLRNLKKANAELQQQLEEQKKALKA
ncbi:uncharacterized protein LOC112881005 [Panicum hallii]|uniref:uncharacterized protein LOC112881005 n=1 Tax=Panicum hallii TaxID=206008 RepID=UPI000DF4CE5F|nr:uncharacterized protein LOC112881005 [Panicum hallii]